MAYTTKAKVENMFGITFPASWNTQVVTAIAAVKQWIDKYCNKTFEAVSETRYYDGSGKNELIIDAFTSIVSVEILNDDGTTYDTLTAGQANDYITAPYNTSEKYILKLTGNGFWGTFSKRANSVKVTGVFGASVTCPESIEIVATKLVGQMFNENAGEGNLTSVKLGDYAATYGSIDEKADALGVYNVLDQYRDISI